MFKLFSQIYTSAEGLFANGLSKIKYVSLQLYKNI